MINTQSLKILVKNRFPGLSRSGRTLQLRLRKLVILLYRPLPSFRAGRGHVRFFKCSASISARPGEVEVREIGGSRENTRTYPPHILEPVDISVRTRSGIATESLLLLRGSKMRLGIGPFNRTGGQNIAIGTSDGTLIEEVSFDIFGPKNHQALARLVTRDPVRLQGKWIVVIEPQGPTYGHWIIELLPRLAWVCGLLGDEVRSFNWLISGSGSEYEKWAMQQLGIPVDKVLWSNKAMSAVIDEAVVPSFVSDGALNILPDMVDRLRDRFCPGIRKPAGKLYVTRKGESFRRVTNEAEVIAALIPLGFTILNPREHSLEEKIRMFSNAKLIVGPVSSGMMHCVFMPVGGGVIEVTPASFYSAADYEVADASGQRFYVMQEQSDTQGVSSNRFADLNIDIEALIGLIRVAENDLKDTVSAVLD